MTVTALTLLAVLAQARGGESKPVPDVSNAKYGTHERHVLDLWKAKSDRPTPVVICIHAGGFSRGSKDQLSASLLRACLEAGISVVAINYRLLPEGRFPAPMRDGARAVQYLRSKATEWNLDPTRMAATGGSAGGGISLWLAFHDDLADPRSSDPVSRQSTRLSCVVATSAQTSYDPVWVREHVGGRTHENGSLYSLLGLRKEELETEKGRSIAREASPIMHVTRDDPPALLLYGGNDEPSDVPGKGIHSRKFGDALQAEMQRLGLTCEVRTGNVRDARAQVEFLLQHFK